MLLCAASAAAASDRAGTTSATTTTSTTSATSTTSTTSTTRELPATVTPLVDGASLVAGTLGQSLQLTSEARAGVALFCGTRYALLGHEGRAEIAMTATAIRHVGRTLLRADV